MKTWIMKITWNDGSCEKIKMDEEGYLKVKVEFKRLGFEWTFISLDFYLNFRFARKVEFYE